MKWWMSWIAIGVVLLSGCNPKPSESKIVTANNYTVKQVREMVGATAVETPPWIAEQYATIKEGISAELMDAIARPEYEDSEWRRDATLRERIKKELLAWKKGEPAPGREQSEVANNFVLVINGQILGSHIAASEGNWPLALKSGLDAFELAWEGFSTAPNLVGADFQLNMWIAADNLAQLSKKSQLSQTQRKTIVDRLELARGEVPHLMSTVVTRDFSTAGVQYLTEMFNAGADASSLGAFIAPMDDPEIRTEKLKAYISSVKNPFDPKTTAEGLDESMYFVTDTSHGVYGFANEGAGIWGNSSEIWGVDLFNTSAENWEVNAMNKTADNAVGEMIRIEILRKYVSAIESSYISQINFSAAIVRAGYEWFKIENKRNPKDLRELNMAIGTQVIDPASGKAFVIDWHNSMLKSEADPLAKELVLLNAIIQNGVPF